MDDLPGRLRMCLRPRMQTGERFGPRLGCVVHRSPLTIDQWKRISACYPLWTCSFCLRKLLRKDNISSHSTQNNYVLNPKLFTTSIDQFIINLNGTEQQEKQHAWQFTILLSKIVPHTVWSYIGSTIAQDTHRRHILMKVWPETRGNAYILEYNWSWGPSMEQIEYSHRFKQRSCFCITANNNYSDGLGGFSLGCFDP